MTDTHAEHGAAKHPYPPRYPRGVHWSIDEAWDILDRLPVGMLPDDYRFLLSGIIAGTLQRRTEDERKRCAKIAGEARFGERDQDFRSIIAAIENPR